MVNRLADHLLEPDQWPDIVRHSREMPLLQAVVAYSAQLDEQTLGDRSTDTDLHRLFRDCAAVATWLPPVTRRIAPHYTRTTWDLRALSALIPVGMDMELSGSDACDGSGFVRWQANLHDHIHGNRARHPSDLEHNAALSYNGGEYGSAWTPNLALARIVLAAYLLAAVQTVGGRALPYSAQQTSGTPSALLTS